MRRVVIDTDGGVDDATALWWAVTDPDLDVVAVTAVWGNVPVEVAAANVLRVLHAAGRPDVPVAVGEAGPIGPTPPLRRATFIHGDDGLGGTNRPPAPLQPVAEPAPALLARVTAEHPGEVAIVTIGPLSNLARAVALDPGLPGRVDELFVMGGSVRRGGNATPAAEANIAHDPDAAHVVATAPWRVPPMLVGLDVTLTATLSPAELALADERRTPAAAYLAEPLRFYERFGASFTRPDCPCHDLLAVLACARPDVVVEAPVLPLCIDRAGGPAWGATIVDLRAPFFAADPDGRQASPDGFSPWRVALGVDVAAFRAHARALFGD